MLETSVGSLEGTVDGSWLGTVGGPAMLGAALGNNVKSGILFPIFELCVGWIDGRDVHVGMVDGLSEGAK